MPVVGGARLFRLKAVDACERPTAALGRIRLFRLGDPAPTALARQVTFQPTHHPGAGSVAAPEVLAVQFRRISRQPSTEG
jgi:hypothetical protein